MEVAWPPEGCVAAIVAAIIAAYWGGASGVPLADFAGRTMAKEPSVVPDLWLREASEAAALTRDSVQMRDAERIVIMSSKAPAGASPPPAGAMAAYVDALASLLVGASDISASSSSSSKVVGRNAGEDNSRAISWCSAMRAVFPIVAVHTASFFLYFAKLFVEESNLVLKDIQRMDAEIFRESAVNVA